MGDADRGNVVLDTFPVKELQGKLVDPEEARKALIAAVNSIPADKLKNVRTGQITVVR